MNAIVDNCLTRISRQVPPLSAMRIGAEQALRAKRFVWRMPAIALPESGADARQAETGRIWRQGLPRFVQ